MSERFAPGARALAGMVGRAWGWRPDEFWRATPAELAAILSTEAETGAAAPLRRDELNALLERERHG